MKTLIRLLILLLAIVGWVRPAAAQGTAFTYQGRLNTNGAPFSGSAEFQFTLWDDPSAGSAVATNNPASIIAPVANGLFMVTLDFGLNPFNGQPRFLETDVRTTIGPFTSLTPRQPLTATPYALRALNLTTNGLAGTYGNAVTFNNAGNSFVGSFAGTFSGAAIGDGSGMTNVSAITLGGLTAGAFWKTNGNAGANPTNGAFLGTTDNLPLEIRVNGTRGLRLEPGTNGDANVLFGPVNLMGPNVNGGTISGGGSVLFGGFLRVNELFADYGAIGGGMGNVLSARSTAGVIAGGYVNAIDTNSGFATIGGGNGSTVGTNSFSGTIAGGEGNRIGNNSPHGAVGGGQGNLVYNNSPYGTIPGGWDNAATNSAFAAGTKAAANHTGSFVWADFSAPAGGPFASTGSNQFLIRATGGVGINTSNPVAGLHVNGSVLIQSPVVTPVTTSSSNLLNILVGGGSSFIATNGSANGISFYETASQKAMSLGYDGSGSSAANALRIYGSTDTPLFTFQNGGNLGVGTATPATVLHVRDAADSEISIESSDTNGHRWTLQSSRVNGSATDASFQIVDRTSGGPRFFIGTNGFVGIGTSAPTNKLHVAGGVSATVFITTSDRNAKENFAPVSPLDVLDKVAALPISRWTFKEMPGQLHLGPMAQDFHAAFGLGAGDTGIATVDADGVALAAIQGLNEKIGEKEASIQEQESRIQNQAAEITDLRQRLDALEKLVGGQKTN